MFASSLDPHAFFDRIFFARGERFDSRVFAFLIRECLCFDSRVFVFLPTNTKSVSSDTKMPSTTRSTHRLTSRLTVQTAVLSIQGSVLAVSTTTGMDATYDSDEDYDSENCSELPLEESVSSKLSSVLHNAWVDLEDEDENYPHDHKHDLATVEPKLENLAEFQVDVEEAFVWWKESVTVRNSLNDVEALYNMSILRETTSRRCVTRLY